MIQLSQGIIKKVVQIVDNEAKLEAEKGQTKQVTGTTQENQIIILGKGQLVLHTQYSV